ncbi:MAG TPA: hypothetical protein VJ385_22510 [Fibrobacteria bacterium]|nr:hypothetical protein [Fibrobacteria bacterium]
MSIILGLFIFVLGLYFLSLFFQVARLEKVMSESVTLLERYMILKYSLGDKKAAAEDGDAIANPEPHSPKPG